MTEDARTRVCVTGGRGLLGRFVVAELEAKRTRSGAPRFDVRVLDRAGES